MKEQEDSIPAVDGILYLRSIGRPGSQPLKPQGPEAIETCVGLDGVEPTKPAFKVRLDEVSHSLGQLPPEVFVAEELC